MLPIIMVDSNLQREELLASERAFAYKMKLEAMKHQGERLDLTSAQVGWKLENRNLAKALQSKLDKAVIKFPDLFV